MSEIEIVVGGTKVLSTTENLVEVNETPDGVNFVFKGNLEVRYIDPFMESHHKQIVKNTADYIRGKKLLFQLQDRKQPAKVISDWYLLN